MEVSSANINFNNNQSFGNTILDNAQLRKRALNGTYKQVDAFVSKLTKNDPKDLSVLDKIRESWRRNTAFSEEIMFCFKHDERKNIYMTELKNKCLKIKQKVCCLMQTTNPDKCSSRDIFHIDFIQSAPSIADRVTQSPIKGAGELTIYEAVKTAKKEGYKRIQLSSIKDDFYSKIGFNEIENTHIFFLENKDFDNFLNRVEKKYNIV